MESEGTHSHREPVDARQALALYLALLERGEEVEFEQFCERFPQWKDELAALYRDWQHVSQVLGKWAGDESLPSRLLRRFGPESLRDLGLEREATPAPEEVFEELFRKLRIKREGFGRYRVKDEVGHGGMGVVLRVWDDELKRHLAMKMIRGGEDAPARESAVDTSTVGRFLDEAQVTAQLEHPGIVPVHELGLDSQGNLYFTMRLVKGSNLGEILELVRAGRDGWNQTRALNVLLKACEALAYAHSKGVIHRDLKPSNIMVGRFGEVYVMDWGLAKIVGVDDRAATELEEPYGRDEIRSERSAAATPGSPLLTRGGHALGTPAYMPPEQARGDLEAMGPHSDVYSMGAILYHVLTGRMPHGDPERELEARQVLARLLERAPISVHALAPKQPPELLAICEKAMAREEKDRYPSVVELAEDLRAFLERRVVKAHRTGAIAELSKWVQRNRGVALASAAAVVLGVTGLTGVSITQAAGRHVAEEKEAATARVAEILIQVFESFTPTVAQGEKVSAEGFLAYCENTLREHLTQETDRPSRVRLQLALGRCLQDLGELRAAERLFRAALGELEQDSNAIQLAQRARRDLGVALQRQGRLSEAEEYLRKALQVCRTNNMTFEDEFDLMGNLGVIYSERGEYEAAQRLHETHLELLADRPDTDEKKLSIYEILAQNHRLRGNFSQAEELLHKVIDLRSPLGEDHPRLIHARHSLGLVLMDQKRIEEAAAVFERALEANQRVLGSRDADICRAMNNLGLIRSGQGRHEEAIRLCEEALEGFRASIGDKHEDFIACLNGLGNAYFGRGESGTALECFSEAHERARSYLAEQHPLRYITASGLAGCHRAMGQPEEGYSILSEALKTYVTQQGSTGPYAQPMRRGVILLAGEAGRLEEAEALAEEFLEHAVEGTADWKAGLELMEMVQAALASSKSTPESSEN